MLSGSETWPLAVGFEHQGKDSGPLRTDVDHLGLNTLRRPTGLDPLHQGFSVSPETVVVGQRAGQPLMECSRHDIAHYLSVQVYS